ncbi:MAG TPA: OPT/YSL family transporter [Vicinamibacterales bacterium]|nr:OPT/YSL family transporter [Vicinamibacterales bacterium]
MKHPSVFEPPVFAAAIALALLGIVIGLELLTRVGVTPNTSIIGAILAMGVARAPIAGFGAFRSVARQNLLQTVISSATFGGANAVFLPIGVAWLVGGRSLVQPMLIGSALGMLIGAVTLYWLFDSPIYPAAGSWPAGVATAECLIAGDEGGRRARLLSIGAGAGGIGQALGVPMDVVGICWIGNAVALAMFAIGLLVRAYAHPLWGIEIDRLYIPHGIMIGAGLVALWQIAGAIGVRPGRSRAETLAGFPSRIAAALALHIGAASMMAALAGLHAMMPAAPLVVFVLFAAAAALVSELIVGISAMHAGWFPAFATALIFLVIGTIARFPAVPLALLVGFAASGGPAFADLGFDLKTGWIVRGRGIDPVAERDGRRQQLIAAVLGFLVAVAFVSLVADRYIAANQLPPADRVYAATIAAGASRSVLVRLIVWAVPGALLQAAGGHARQMGVLFATGLLIYNPAAGWTALAALSARTIAERRFGERAQAPMYVLAGGFLSGSAIVSFGAATMKAR